MKRIYLSWQDIENHTQEILRRITHDAWRPDYVVGITRGGLVPANLISQYLEVPMHCLKVSLMDSEVLAKVYRCNKQLTADAFSGWHTNPPPRISLALTLLTQEIPAFLFKPSCHTPTLDQTLWMYLET